MLIVTYLDQCSQEQSFDVLTSFRQVEVAFFFILCKKKKVKKIKLKMDCSCLQEVNEDIS